MIRLARFRRVFAPPPRPRVNLGCGLRRHADWTNCDLVPAGPDVIACDLRRPLPFATGSCTAVYAAHVLEHLPPATGRRLVGEIHRVLGPGGVVRIVVPDLEGIVRAYLASLERAAADGTPESRWEHRWMTVELLDQLVRDRPGGLMRRWWSCDPVPGRAFILRRLGQEAAAGIAAVAAERQGHGGAALAPEAIFDAAAAGRRETARLEELGERHRWMYDRLSLVELLAATGFTAISRADAVSSRIPGFPESFLDTDEAGRPRKPDSLYVEGERP